MVDLHTFHISFNLLPIQGADVVLGVQWLQTIGPFVSDYTISSMEFYHQGRLITLKGTTNSTLLPTTFHQISRMIHTDAIATFHAISMVPTTYPHPPNQDPNLSSTPFSPADLLIINTLPKDLANILHHFSQVFSVPHGLPSKRPHDHHIHLIPNSSPVNTRPYRYPHFQKETMTQIIAEMHRDGIIRPSTCPYSSPVLLVKKKMARGVFVWTIAP